MGDVRFERHYLRLKEADNPLEVLRALGDEEVVSALAAASQDQDPYLANVLASDALNRVRRKGAILETANEGLVAVDAAGRVTYANPAAASMLGCPREGVVGTVFHEAFHARDLDGNPCTPDQCSLVVAALRGGPPVRREDILRRRGGGAFPVDATVAPILRDGEVEGCVVTFVDTTARKHAEAELRRSEARLRVLFEEAPAIYVIVDEAGRIRAANRHALQDLGYDLSELLGQPVVDTLFHPDDRESVRQQLVAFLAGEPTAMSWEFRKVRKDGSVIWVQENLRTLGERGRGREVLMVCQDITHLVESSSGTSADR